MIRWHWRYFVVCFLLLTPISSNGTNKRQLLEYLFDHSIAILGDTLSYHYRVKQIHAESYWNPSATSDFKGWKKKGIDTVTAVRQIMGAAGLAQFIWTTAQRYGAQAVTTSAADDTILRADIYNPYWSLQAHCRYMHTIMLLLRQTSNKRARRLLMLDRKFFELCAVSAYNCGEQRVLTALKNNYLWCEIKHQLPKETQLYAERIVLQ